MAVEDEADLHKAYANFKIGNKKDLEDLLYNEKFYNSTLDAVHKLNIEKVKKEYGEIGLDRYIRSITDTWDDEDIQYPRKKHNLSSLLKSVLISPAKLIGKIYDYALSKTGSHLISTMASTSVAGELVGTLSFMGESAYISHSLNIPFLKLLSEEIPLQYQFFIQIPLITAAVAAVFIGMITGGTSMVFNHKMIEKKEIERDLRRYKDKFNRVFSNYSKEFFGSNIEDTLENLNSIYMMSSSKTYERISKSKEDLKRYEKEMLPYIEHVIKKDVNPNLVFYRSPKGVGGFTLIYNSILGKFFKHRSYSPVFLNVNRIKAVPEYLFALFHEISHGAGATTEQMASYYASIAMEKVSKKYPLQGYDLFISANNLESAVATFAKKFKSKEEFFSRLKELNLPKFVIDSFDSRFNPFYSITFPLYEAMFSGPVESKFTGLYASGPYIAYKLVKKGIIKTF